MKFGITHLYKTPTPAFWCKVGDAIMAASLFAMPYPIINNLHVLAIVIVSLGMLGKFLTSFFGVDNKNDTKS
jgi:predicted benzoate:H+ symporter BenE